MVLNKACLHRFFLFTPLPLYLPKNIIEEAEQYIRAYFVFLCRKIRDYLQIQPFCNKGKSAGFKYFKKYYFVE